MKKIKKICIICLIGILILINIKPISYGAGVEVTQENLTETMQGFVESAANDKNYKVTVNDGIITISVDDEEYTLNYDLTEKPTFFLEIPIKQGMSYEEFKNQTDNLTLPMLGYIAVANVQGVEFEDALSYFFMSYLGNALSGSWSSEDMYMIIDDTNTSDGVTFDRDESNSKTIYASEFGERVMEYVNSLYKDKQTVTDVANGGIDSYEFSVERKDVTDTSCTLVASLSVNIDADFSKIKGYADELGSTFTNSIGNTTIDSNTTSTNDIIGSVRESNTANTSTNTNVNISNSSLITNTTENISKTTKRDLPTAGIDEKLIILIVAVSIIILASIIQLRRYKDIK